MEFNKHYFKTTFWCLGAPGAALSLSLLVTDGGTTTICRSSYSLIVNLSSHSHA